MEEKYSNYEDEISLKELIMTLIQEKKIIGVITSLTTIVAIIVSFFIISPTYEAATSFVMTIPESVQTKVGTYHYITTSYSDYLPLIKDHRVLNMTIEDLNLDTKASNLAGRIEYILPDSKDASKKGISLIVSGGDPEENASIANKHIENYIEFLNIDFKDKAIEQFIRNYGVSLELIDRNLETTKKQLEEANLLISEINPVLTLQKALTSNPEVAAKYAEDRGVNVKDLTRDMLYDELVNPNYASMDSLILEYKKSISNYNVEKERLLGLLEELDKEREALDNYYSTGDKSMFTEGYVEVFNSKIQVMSPAVVPQVPVAPRKMLNVAIGLVLGLMVGVFVAFFKAYWESN